MKNAKLTLATALSVLAITFTGTAFADGGDRQNNRKHVTITKVQTSNNVNRQAIKKVNKTTTVERVVVKNTPNKKVIITKTIIKKPATLRYVANKSFNQRGKYSQRVNYKNRYKRHNDFKAITVPKRLVYSVRPGDTLISISLKTGVNIHRLARLNRLNHGRVNYLQIGQLLRLG